MAKHANTHYLDVDDFEVARSLHRVVRAMHDGECPRCHWLFESTLMRGRRVVDADPVVTQEPHASSPVSFDMVCPSCGFAITDQEAKAAIDMFAPVMERNLEIFEQWRQAIAASTKEG